MAAFFCEGGRLEEGRISFDRLVDEVVADGQTAKAFLMLVIAIYPGSVRGRKDLLITWEHPTGERTDIPSDPVDFTGDMDICNWRIPCRLEITNEWGIHWYAVRLDGRLLTKIPLRVIYDPARIAASRGRS